MRLHRQAARRPGARARPGCRRPRPRRARSRSPRARGAPQQCAVKASSSHSARASAMKKSGTQIPSLRPLSTLRPCRIRDGTRSSVTTAWPSAASVHASMIESTSASTRLTPGSTPTPARVPKAIVSGKPDPEQPGRYRELLAQGGSEIREASAKRTSVSVASASSLTGSLPMLSRSGRVPVRRAGPRR